MIQTNIAIRSFKGGYDDNFQYLVTCIQSGAQMIVDAALPLETVRPYLHGVFVAVLITHTHGDHIAYLNEYLHAYPNLLVIIYEESIHKIDAENIHPAKDGQEFHIGELKMDILHTPGHYPDSLCFVMEHVIFTGDTLFVGRTGRTIAPESNTRQLYHSVYDKLLTLPPNTIIYSGHDYGVSPTITLGENIEISPLLQAANDQDFIERMAAYEASRNQIL